MYKRVLSFTLVITILISLLSITAIAADTDIVEYDDFWNNTITEIAPIGNEYIITKASELAWIAEAVNKGEITCEGYTIKLAANLNFRGHVWTPIGTLAHPFSGSFDGQGHTIGGLQPIGFTNSGRDCISGLFGYIVVKPRAICSISNLNIVDNAMNFSASFIYDTRAGSVAGEIRVFDGATLNIENCKSSGSAIAGGNATVGGLIGNIITEGPVQISISNVTSETDVYSNSSILSHGISGGLVGAISPASDTVPANVSIISCQVNASIKSKTITGNTQADAGGLVGILNGGDIFVNECMVKGELYSEADTATVAGVFSAVYFNCLNLINTFVETEFSTKASVNNCVGGLLGLCECTGELTDSTIKNCYVSSFSGIQFSAGFIVRNRPMDRCINIQSSFFDMDKMGLKSEQRVLSLEILSDNWINTDNISTSFGLNTDEIPFSRYFSDWDFNNVWTWDENGYPVLRVFYDSEGGNMEVMTEDLVGRVKKYTSEFHQEDIDAIINGSGTDVEKANALITLYNQINDSMGELQSFTTLTSNDIYASYLMMDRLRSTVGGTMARLFLGLNGLIYGEWKDHIVGDDPAYSKYKTLLSAFMKETQEEFELFSYISTTTEFLEGISAVLEEQGISHTELSKVVVEVRLADSISEADHSLSKLSGTYTISSVDLDIEAFDELFSKLGKVADFTDITYKSIVEMSNLASNVECYHLYEDFLDFVACNEELPSQLRAAAEDLNKTLEEQYSAAMADYVQEAAKWVIDNSVETVGSIIFDDSLIRSFGYTFSEIIPGVTWGIVIANSTLNMSDFVNSATYVEGYGMLQEQYTKKLLTDKDIFLESSTEENAKLFYRDYTLLWHLRDKGEEMFLQFAGYDGTWQGSVRQKLTFWIKYEELRQITNVSRNYLTYSAFTFKDSVTTKSDLLHPFNQTVIVDCPVDVNIYDETGEHLLGKIENGNAVKLDEEALLSLWSDGTQKIISMPSEMGYGIQVTATGNGTMSYYVSIEDTSDTLGYANRFADVPIEIGTQILNTAEDNYHSLQIETDAGEDVVNPTEEWQPDVENPSDYIQITVPQSSGGTVYGASEYLKGKYVILTANANDGFTFNGWYENDILISYNETIGFFAYTNREISAKFNRVLPISKVITSVVPIENKAVPLGTTIENLDLPQKVDIVFEDGSTDSISVTWSSYPLYNSKQPGCYVFTGELQQTDDISNPNHLTAQFTVTVEMEQPDRVPVTGVKLIQQNVSLSIDDTQQLSAEVFPQNATNKNVHWSSSDPTIAAVSDSGMVMAVSTGTAIITVATEDEEFVDTCVVEVSRKDSGGSSSETVIHVTYVSSSTDDVVYAVSAAKIQSGVLIAAGYQNNRLLDTVVVDYSGNTVQVILPSEADLVAFFLLDNLQNAHPLSNPYSIKQMK